MFFFQKISRSTYFGAITEQGVKKEELRKSEIDFKVLQQIFLTLQPRTFQGDIKQTVGRKLYKRNEKQYKTHLVV